MKDTRVVLYSTIMLLALMIVGACGSSRKMTTAANLKEGDILFQALPCGGMCDAIIATTPCAADRRFNHCGILHFSDGKAYVIEAIGSRVQRTELNKFLARDTNAMLAIGRMKGLKANTAKLATAKAATYIGRPYDDVFMPGDNALYCSELIWESYKTEDARPVFTLQPMTFKPSVDAETHPAWEKYYMELKAAVPEGVPGINPCAIATSDKIDFFWVRK